MNPTDPYLYRIRNWFEGEMTCDYLTHNDAIAECEREWDGTGGLESQVTIVTLPPEYPRKRYFL